MSLARRAKRRDENEPAIIQAALSVGASVIQLDEIDLAIGFRGTTYLVEVKNPEYPHGHKERRERQKRLLDGWQGGKTGIVETPEDLLRLIGAIK